MLGERVHHGQGSVDLQPTHRRELLGDDGLQPRTGTTDHPGLAQRRGALVETGRVDALRPAGVLSPQVVVELQQRPPLQHLRRRDVALRHPPCGQQMSKQLRIGLVCLGPPLRSAQHRGVRRLGQMRCDADLAHLLRHIPPAGTALHRERRRRLPVETGQPVSQMLAVGWRDPTPLQPAGLHLDVVEGQLLPMNIQAAYDRHRDLLKLRDHRCPTQPLRLS